MSAETKIKYCPYCGSDQLKLVPRPGPSQTSVPRCMSCRIPFIAVPIAVGCTRQLGAALNKGAKDGLRDREKDARDGKNSDGLH